MIKVERWELETNRLEDKQTLYIQYSIDGLMSGEMSFSSEECIKHEIFKSNKKDPSTLIWNIKYLEAAIMNHANVLDLEADFSLFTTPGFSFCGHRTR